MISAPKRHWRGTHRTASPEETFSRVMRLAPVLGITRVANVTGLDSIGVPVATASRPNARSLSVSQGKGADVISAKVSALMESVEAYHAERIFLPLKFGAYDELRFTHSMVDPELLPKRAHSTFHGRTRIFWIEGKDLATQKAYWVPFELVHLNYTLPSLPGSGCFLGTSNGLASGNHILEAVAHGIDEVVERDATTLWHMAGEEARARTRIDPSTVDDEACREVLDRFGEAGVSAGIWETTSDIGIASFLCIILETSPNPLRPLPPSAGMGCHPAREIALLRALTEAAQSRLTMISGARDDLAEALYRKVLDPEAQRRVQDWLDRARPTRDFRMVPTHLGQSLDDDVAWQHARLEAAGFPQVIAVDLTRPELKIPVVRIIVPGLEALHSNPGYVPGVRALRTRDVGTRGLRAGQPRDA